MKTELKISLGFWQTIHIHGAKESENILVLYQPGLLVGTETPGLSKLGEEEPGKARTPK